MLQDVYIVHAQVEKPWKWLHHKTNQPLCANSENPATKPRSIKDSFLFQGRQWIVTTVVILMVTVESYAALVCFLSSLRTHMQPSFALSMSVSIHRSTPVGAKI